MVDPTHCTHIVSKSAFGSKILTLHTEELRERTSALRFGEEKLRRDQLTGKGRPKLTLLSISSRRESLGGLCESGRVEKPVLIYCWWKN